MNTLSDDSQHTHSARDIVLELFPATHERLIPGPSNYKLQPDDNGNLCLLTKANEPLITLYPVPSSGNPTTQLCCDFCQHSANRQFLQHFRVEIPGSDGRRFRYVTLCRNHDSCEVRRLNDDPIRQLLARVFN